MNSNVHVGMTMVKKDRNKRVNKHTTRITSLHHKWYFKGARTYCIVNDSQLPKNAIGSCTI